MEGGHSPTEVRPSRVHFHDTEPALNGGLCAYYPGDSTSVKSPMSQRGASLDSTTARRTIFRGGARPVAGMLVNLSQK